MEDELFKAGQLNHIIWIIYAYISYLGKGIAARRCLEDSSRSEFDAVDHSDFLNWLASSSRSASSTPQQEHAELPALSKKRSHELSNSSNGFNVFSVAPTNTSDQGTNRTKRVRYTSKETPPCLRCRIIKKKVCNAVLYLCNVTNADSAMNWSLAVIVQTRVTKMRMIFGRFLVVSEVTCEIW